ncbi:hypothetical protein JCM14076_13440 [Methylosoma difficile]
MNLFSKIGIVLFLYAVVNVLSADEKPKIWPKIKPTSLSSLVTTEHPKFVLNIFSEENPEEKLYELRCNDGDAVDDDSVEYYGMYKCQLFYKSNIGVDLINGIEHWTFNKTFNTRGGFASEQMLGPCNNNPEFGHRREFNLRGIKLELTVSNFSSPSMVDMLSGKEKPHYSFNFEAKVTSNINASTEYSTPIAEKYCGGYYKLDSNGKAIYHELIY